MQELQVQSFVSAKCTLAIANKDLQPQTRTFGYPLPFSRCKNGRQICSDKINFSCKNKIASNSCSCKTQGDATAAKAACAIKT